MAKPTALAARLSVAAGKKPAPPTATVKKEAPETVLVGAHFSPEVRRSLIIVRGKTGLTMRQVIGEAINDLCSKYGVAEPYDGEA